MENKTHLYNGLDLVKLKDQVKKIASWHNEFDYVDEWEKEFIRGRLSSSISGPRCDGTS